MKESGENLSNEDMVVLQKGSRGPAWGGAGLPKPTETSEASKPSTEYPVLGRYPAAAAEPPHSTAAADTTPLPQPGRKESEATAQPADEQEAPEAQQQRSRQVCLISNTLSNVSLHCCCSWGDQL